MHRFCRRWGDFLVLLVIWGIVLTMYIVFVPQFLRYLTFSHRTLRSVFALGAFAKSHPIAVTTLTGLALALFQIQRLRAAAEETNGPSWERSHTVAVVFDAVGITLLVLAYFALWLLGECYDPFAL